jgi:gamma-D-glutamyl-L-lysine dipeptidyl-peptidase
VKQIKLVVVFMLLLAPLSSLFAVSKKAVVTVPVADVWSRALDPGTTGSDDWRETQVLFGEKVLIHESSGPWLRIEAVEQPEFTHHNKWEGYPGWVWKDALTGQQLVRPPTHQVSGARWYTHDPLGAKHYQDLLPYPPPAELTRLPLHATGTSNDIMKTAALLMGTPYLWGGLSSPPPVGLVDTPAISSYGIDCSGLVHLAYRVNGIGIPRDAHEQWMKAKSIKRAELRPADLIFSAKADNPKKITHVALFAGWSPPHPALSQRERGDALILEAPQTGMVVRQISFKEKYGRDLSEVESGQTVGDRVIYFGSFLK